MNINDIKTTPINLQKKKWQRGLSLIEASMVLILSAVVVAGVMSYYQTAQDNNKLEQTLSQTLSVVAGVQGMFTSHSSYAGLSTKAVVQSGYIPSSGISSDKKNVVNAYGTVTDIIATDDAGKAPASGTDPTNYVIVIRGLDSSQCSKIGSQKIEGSQIATSIESSFSESTGMTQTTPVDQITPVTIAAKCKVNSTNDVVFLMK